MNLLPPVNFGEFEQIAGQDAAAVVGPQKFVRLGVVFRDLDRNGNGVFDAWEITSFGILGVSAVAAQRN